VSASAPDVGFATVGFSDGRPASADPGRDALDQSGAETTATDLANMASTRLEAALTELRAGQS
jgi:hypothetical protein